MISLKQFHNIPSLCLDRFGEGTIATSSSSLFISDSLEFNASIVLVFVSLLEKNLSLKRESRSVATVNVVFVSMFS